METNVSPSNPLSGRTSHQAHSFNNMVDDGRKIAYDFQQEHNFKDVKCCYYLLEAMPLPGPTWSTTGPTILAEPPSLIEASMELELGENNQASSYTWWLGFLKGLDGNMSIEKKMEKEIVMEHNKGVSFESKFVDAIDLGCCPDDWLIIPPMEKDLGDKLVP
ncbi:hypothetical protein MTR_7g071570 [Medicago truncatula]|uniref:Uncharacterized protein n=1 Tax=Medicago truncatula TaxID=3880 RepID=G7KV41_MEDTR|nr:hypothetical protein MTR_7g071570 [Medicago truncatula]